MRWNTLGRVGLAVLASVFLVSASAWFAQSTVTQLSGLAVAQNIPTTIWNSVRDGSSGDNLLGGILAVNPFTYDGTNFDRARGDIANGLDVDVTRIAGAVTPSDAEANPTTLIPVQNHNMMFNGTTWDRLRGTIANGLSVDVTREPVGTLTPTDASANPTTLNGVQNFGMVWNGTTWDRAPGTTVGANIIKDTSGTSFFAIRDTGIAQVSQNFAFGFTSKKVMITASVGTVICVDWLGGTAVCPVADTAGDDVIVAGETIILEDIALTSISAIAPGIETNTITVRAWN